MHPLRRTAAPSRGFTLVELLVVIVIIAMLMAMVLPAVNSAREAGRRTTCINNQFQQAFALIRFNDSKRYVPGWRNAMVTASGTMFFSWPFMILPNLEQTATQNAVLGGATPFAISIFACPSSPADNPAAPTLAYAGGAGAASNAATTRATGVMLDTAGTNGRVSMDDVASNDGTAMTLILSEKCLSGTNAYFQATWDVRPTGSNSFAFTNGASSWAAFPSGPIPAFGLSGGVVPTKVINSGSLTPLLSQPSSNHANGVVAAFCDGHTQFLKDSLQAQVYAQLMSWNHSACITAAGTYLNWTSGGTYVLKEADFQ